MKCRNWWRFAAAAALLAALVLWHPAAESRFHLCGFLWLTGRPCPLCGMTRGFCALAKGHIAEAIAFNLLSPAAFLAFLAVGVTGRLPKAVPVVAPLAIYGVLRAARVLP